MAYWLLKSEPASWSWDQQVAAGEAGTFWSGVRNHVAKKNLQAMRCGDGAFFYHSGEGKAIVGIVAVIREFYPDPTDDSGKFRKSRARVAAPRDPESGQGRADAQEQGARHPFAALRAAGHR